MKKSIAGLVAMAGLSCCTAAQAQVVISAVYGGGSSTSTTFLSEFAFDFVELKNNGNSPVTLTGYSLQRRSATGMASFNDKINLPSITIPANGFYLVRTEPGQTGTCGAGAPCRPVPADFFATTGAGGSGQLQLGGTSSVVALLSNQTLLTGCPSNNPAVIDLVGYGNGSTFGQPVANCSETLPCNNTGNEFTAVRLVNGCQDTNNNAVDFVIQGSQYTPRNAGSAPAPCTGGCPADCNTNGTCDNVEINAAGGVGGIGGTLDCNNNGQLDSCEILSNPQIDCNGNGVIDSCELNATTDCNSNGQLDQCEIAANPSLDCDGNNLLDVCQITANPTLDCDSTGRLDDCERVENPSFYDSNNNGINDGCETPGPGQDCNGNNRLDSWDLRVYTLTDVDANGIPDTCEGAVYVEVPVNATVQVGGVRSAPNGERFINIEGATFAEFASYAGLRWSNATVMNGLGATDSVGRVYLRRATPASPTAARPWAPTTWTSSTATTMRRASRLATAPPSSPTSPPTSPIARASLNTTSSVAPTTRPSARPWAAAPSRTTSSSMSAPPTPLAASPSRMNSRAALAS